MSVVMLLMSMQLERGNLYASETVVDGTTVSEPVKGVTYYFDFASPTSSIYNLGELTQAVEGTSTKTGELGLMTIVTAGQFHDAQHGMYKTAEMTFKVPGTCTITIGGCCYSGESTMFTVTSETGNIDVSQQSTKTANCYKETNTDGTDRVVFKYTGSAGVVTFSATGGYIPRIEITSEPNSVDTAADISSVSIGLSDMIAVKFHVALDETVSEDDYMNVTVGDKN